jgi:hypothetical protein
MRGADLDVPLSEQVLLDLSLGISSICTFRKNRYCWISLGISSICTFRIVSIHFMLQVYKYWNQVPVYNLCG